MLSGQPEIPAERLGLHQEQSAGVSSREARFCPDSGKANSNLGQERVSQWLLVDQGEAGTQEGRWLLWIVNIEPQESTAKAGRETQSGNVPSQPCLALSASSAAERTQPSIFFPEPPSLQIFPCAHPLRAQPGLPISNWGTARCSNHRSYRLLEGSWGTCQRLGRLLPRFPLPRSASLPSLRPGESCVSSPV